MRGFSGLCNAMENFSEKFLKISQVLLAWIALAILSPVLILIFGSLFIWKYGVLWVIVKLFKRKFLHGFDPVEAVFAVDRFWENSRSSLGLIVELDGPINVDNFRDEFKKKILDYVPSKYVQENTPSVTPSDTDESLSPKPFAKLTQIPSTFCGYYYWQKANYFLIHEHIRQINQPTDELGLKKAVGTLMTLPFPNRRPLWEILVYPNYLGTTTVGRGTTCGSALFIRIHRSVTDSQGLMNILRHMMLMPMNDKSKADIQTVQISVVPDDSKTNNAAASSSVQNETTNGGVRQQQISWSETFTSLVFLPLRTFQFAQKVIQVPEGIAKSEGKLSAGQEWDSANASWTLLPDMMVRKVCSSQTPPLARSTVEMSIFLEGMTCRSRHKCLSVPEEKGVPAHQQKCRTCVLISVPHPSSQDQSTCEEELLTNRRSFVTVKCPCIASLQSSNKTDVLKSIQNQLHHHYQPTLGENDDRDHYQIVKIYLRFLSLLPRHVLRYLLLSRRWGAGYFILEQFEMELPVDDKTEFKLFDQRQICQIVPLVSLQWTHTLASAATLKWHDGNIIMSLIANAGIVGPISEGNPQDHTERIVRGFPEELERLSDDAEDHGFVSISIS